MIIQCLVYAGYGLHLLQHGAYVVADEDDGAVVVNLCQKFVKAGFEALVDVGAGFVEDYQLGVGDDGASQQGALQLSATQCTDGAVFQPSSPMRAMTWRAFSRCDAVKREISDFCELRPERITSSTVMGNLRSILLY